MMMMRKFSSPRHSLSTSKWHLRRILKRFNCLKIYFQGNFFKMKRILLSLERLLSDTNGMQKWKSLDSKASTRARGDSKKIVLVIIYERGELCVLPLIQRENFKIVGKCQFGKKNFSLRRYCLTTLTFVISLAQTNVHTSLLLVGYQ